jgi:hypothetical protein
VCYAIIDETDHRGENKRKQKPRSLQIHFLESDEKAKDYALVSLRFALYIMCPT